MSVPRASAFERRGTWLRNSKFVRMSWTLLEKPSRVVLKVGLELLLVRPAPQVAQRELR